MEIDFVVPGPLDQRTGGYLYDRRIVDGIWAEGHTLHVHELAGRFPEADEPARLSAADVLGGATGLLVIDGLALPAFAGILERAAGPWVALVHHPLPLETGLGPTERARYEALERALLPKAARIVVTSPATARDLKVYDVAPERIGVVVPGTDPAPLAEGSGEQARVLLTVGTLTPRKGHLLLIEALSGLRHLSWRLDCCGSEDRDPATTRAVRAAVTAAELDERVRFLGEVGPAGLATAYAHADVVVSASYHEGYGMALAEALARGLPVISTRGGAVAETVPEGAGLLVEPGNVLALRAALARFLDQPDVRRALRTGARLARQSLPSWPQQVAAFSNELQKVSAS